MKIAVAINTYKYESDMSDRQQWCVQSLRKVQSIYPDNVELYNIMFQEDNIEIKGFTPLPVLQLDSEELVGEKTGKELPSVKEIFTRLAKIDSKPDYFLFLNDDIILSDRFIDFILKNPTYDAFPASRVHLYNFTGLDCKDFITQAYSVAGFDAFAIRPDWWLSVKSIFPEYLLGKPYWDTHFFTLCMLTGKCKVMNKLPPVIFHPDHKSTACTNVDKMLTYNQNLAGKAIEMNMWWRYVYEVLEQRKDLNGMMYGLPFENEEELEKDYFRV